MEIYIDVTLFIFFYLVINQKSSPLQIPQKRSSNSQVPHHQLLEEISKSRVAWNPTLRREKWRPGCCTIEQNLGAMPYLSIHKFQKKNIYMHIYIKQSKGRKEMNHSVDVGNQSSSAGNQPIFWAPWWWGTLIIDPPRLWAAHPTALEAKQASTAYVVRSDSQDSQETTLWQIHCTNMWYEINRWIDRKIDRWVGT